MNRNRPFVVLLVPVCLASLLLEGKAQDHPPETKQRAAGFSFPLFQLFQKRIPVKLDADLVEERREAYESGNLLRESDGEGLAKKARLSRYLQLPPAMHKQVGDPTVVALRGARKTSSALEVEIQPEGAASAAAISDRLKGRASREPFEPGESRIGKIVIRGTSQVPASEVKVALSRAVLNHFWDSYFAERDNTLEAITLNRERFLRIGMASLQKENSILDDSESAWWTVRMGLPQEQNSGHHLAAVVGTYAEGFSMYGHFALALRKEGGDPVNDILLDPRAPWEKDEPPTAKDWGRGGEELIAGVHSRNLYDWLYTQTHYRGLIVRAYFVEASVEQVHLIRELDRRDDLQEIARFRTFRYNCATLGEQIFDRLLPIGHDVCRSHPIADIPDRLAKKIDRRFDSVNVIEMGPQGRSSPEERSSDWTTRPAPDREATPEFIALRDDPAINGVRSE